MIRVLHCVNKMNRGGLETMIMYLYRNLDRSRIQFDFLVNTDEKGDYDNEIQHLGGKIFHVTPRRKGILKNMKELDSFFKTHKDYQIVHMHLSSLSYIQPLIAARDNGVKHRIIHSHNSKGPSGLLHNVLHYLNSKRLDKIVTHQFACSEEAAKWLYGKSGIDLDKVRIIRNAINTEDFLYNEERRAIVRNELLLDGKFVIGHVGRFTKQKNHKFIIDIFKKVYEKNNNAILMLIGDGEIILTK